MKQKRNLDSANGAQGRWRAMLAGGSVLLIGALSHQLLLSTSYVPESAAINLNPWFLVQGLDFTVAVLCGMLVIRYAPGAFMQAGAVLLLPILLQAVLAPLPLGIPVAWIGAGLVAGPLGLVLGICWGCYRLQTGHRPAQPPSLLDLFAPPPDKTAPAAPHTGLLEALALSAVCFGAFILSSAMQAQAAAFRSFDFSFSERDLLAIVLTEMVLAALALGWLRFRNYPLSSLLPRPSQLAFARGFMLYLLTLSLSAGMVQLFSSLGPAEADPSIPLSQGNISLTTILLTAVVNGLYEEVFLLGFLLRGLRRYGMAAAFLVSLLIRTLFHTYQGPLGMVSVLIFGLVLSLYYWRSRALFPVVAAHALGDIVPFLLN